MCAFQVHSNRGLLLNLSSTATRFYFARPDEVTETADMFLEGEDEYFDNDDSDEEGSSPSTQPRSRTDGDKPIRLLTDFTIFDTRHRNEYVVLSQIEEEEGVDRRFEATGWAVPSYADEQDLMGEDEGAGEEVVEPVFMHIGPVLGYSIDWRQDNAWVMSHFTSNGFVAILNSFSALSTLRPFMPGIFSECRPKGIFHGIKCFIRADGWHK